MISFTTNINKALNNVRGEGPGLIEVAQETFYLLGIFGDDFEYLSTTFYEDIRLSDNRLYKADGAIFSVSPPKIYSNVDRGQYQVVLDDSSLELSNSFPNNIIGLRMVIRVGFVLDSDEHTGPLTDISDTLVSFDGPIDSYGVVYDTAEVGSVQIRLTGANPIFNLDERRFLFLNKENIRARVSTDSCCDQIYQGSLPLKLRWGR
jgi:hypothetical protein